MTDATNEIEITTPDFPMPRHEQQAEEHDEKVERWIEASKAWQDPARHVDPVHVTIDHRGHVSGGVFHTTEHLKDNPRWGNGTPPWRYVERSVAIVFGMRECRICERSRVLGDKVDDGLVVMAIEGDTVRLRAWGKPLVAKVGHYIEPGQGVTMLTEQVREKLGIAADHSEEEGE